MGKVRKRRLSLIGAWGGLFLLTACLAWAATWLRPPQPACLVLIGAGYEDNLSFPHNYYGWQSLEQLADLTRESSSLSFWGRKLLTLKQEPVRLRTDTRWDQGLNGIEERTVVVIMSVHGGADPQGPYLLPQDAGTSPEGRNRLSLTTVLDRLAQLPADKHKVLVLDVTAMRVCWPLGMLENAFVRELRNLEDRITNIPNCVVLCASDHSQRSWVSEDYRRTAYLHFLAEGLRGDAIDSNHDGRLNLWELHSYTRDNVENWVARNRSAQQTPILLPDNEKGIARAKQIDLCIHRTEYANPLPSQTNLPEAQLRDLWQAYQELEQTIPTPATYTPQIWRRYQIATMRCEELLCAGDVNNAARLRNLLRDLTIEIQRSRELKLCSVPNTLTMPNVAGMTPLPATAGREVLQKLWSAEPQKYTSIWSEAKAAARVPQLLQLSLYQQLMLRAAEDPANNLAKASKLFEMAHDPLHCGPAETQLMIMLNRDLPAWARQPAANELIALALQVRLLAEQAAAGVSQGEYTYSEEVYPWIELQIADADRQRRLGEDLLFATANQQTMAFEYLQLASQGYKLAINSADRVRTALKLRDETLAQLPFYSQWLAHHVSDNLIRPGDETLISGLQSLWRETHLLATVLQTPNPQWIGTAPPASLLNPTPRNLVDQTNVVQQSYRFLETRLSQRWEDLSRIELAEVCPDVERALAVPFDEVELRIKLLLHMRRVSRRFAMDQVSPSASDLLDSTTAERRALVTSAVTQTNQVSTVGQSPIAKGPSPNATASNKVKDKVGNTLPPVAPHTHATSDTAQPQGPSAFLKDMLNLPTLQEERDELENIPSLATASGDMADMSDAEISIQSKSAARWQGQVALAVLGEAWFNACPGENLETYAQVQHRLGVFNVEENWWVSLLAAGQQIGKRWNCMAGTIHELVSDSARQDEAMAQQTLQQASCLARLLDESGTISISDDPSGAYRRLKLQRFLVSNAYRTLLEHWYSLDPNTEPYYATAGLVYLNDAQRMFPNSSAVAPLRQQLIKPTQLVVNCPQSLEITSEPRFQIRYEIRLPDAPDASLGYPVCWFESEPLLTLIQPEPDQRVFQQPTNSQAPSFVTAVVDNPTLLQSEANPGVAATRRSSLTLFAYYRGQQITANTRVLLNGTPDVVRVQLPTAAPANLAVRADAELQAEFGSGSGAVAIVLDCSGSMGPKSGDPFVPTTKYVEATTALQRVLQNIPVGTQVSLWVFGQAMGSGKTVPHAEDTIRQVQAPVAWNPQVGNQLSALMAKVNYPAIEPWNESPILRAMLAAKNDLSSVTGFKTLLVITDGMDNRFAEDAQANPNKQDIPAALISAFQDSGILVNIVGFKVVGGEQAEAKRQFSAVERLFPPGRFYPVDQAAALASALDAAMEQRLRYWIEDFQDQRLSMVPADGFDVGQSGAGDHWIPNGLPAGNFQISAQGKQPVRMPVAFDPGDLLLLRIGQQSGQLNFQRMLYSQTDYGWKPWRENNGWRLSVLQNQQLPNEAMQMLIALEQQPAPNETYLRMPKPQELWLEVQPRDDKQSRSTRWGYSSEYPAPTWSVDIAGWPRDATMESPIRPLVNVWWCPDQPAPAAVTLLRNRDYNSLDDLTNLKVQALSAEVMIDQVAMETHIVEVSPGVREERACLAVRMSLPESSPYWVRPQGISFAGSEHRYYEGTNKYTGLFWPVTADEAAKVLNGFGLISLAEFKAEAERRGFATTMNSLPAPNPDDSRPRPPVGN